MNSYAPIALFVYNRPKHVKRVIEAIKKNKISQDSIIYIFSDFSTETAEKKKIQKIRKFLKNLKCFKKIIVIERKHNLGTSKNIILGLNQIFKKYSRCIVIEDDILISKNFLFQMNYFLEKFKRNNKVASIEGFMYPAKFQDNIPNYFYLKGTGCWGWATWKRSWKDYENSAEKLLNKFNDKKKLIYDFNYYDTYPYYRMLKKQVYSKKKSWAIKWYASNYHKNKYTIYFKNTLVKNIGLDGSGENCIIDYQINQKKFSNQKHKIKLNIKLEENITAKKNIANYLSNKFSFKNKINFVIKRLLK